VVIEQFILQFSHINPYVTLVAAITLAAGHTGQNLDTETALYDRRDAGRQYRGAGIEYGNRRCGDAYQNRGALPAGLPPLSLPDFSYGTIHKVLFPALLVTCWR